MRSSACSTTSAPCSKAAPQVGVASSPPCAWWRPDLTSPSGRGNFRSATRTAMLGATQGKAAGKRNIMAYGANAAILYRPEAFTTQGTKLMGRQAAGEGFMRGFVRHANVEKLFCYAPQREQVEHFAAAAKGAGNQR